MARDKTPSKPLQNEAFNRWCFTAMDDGCAVRFDDGKPPPVLTTFLYRVCGNDPAKFDEGCRILQLCFEAGQREGL